MLLGPMLTAGGLADLGLPWQQSRAAAQPEAGTEPSRGFSLSTNIFVYVSIYIYTCTCICMYNGYHLYLYTDNKYELTGT